MKKLFIVLYLATTLICTSLNGRDLAGQVFIVTKAHKSVKLGLVSISIYPRDAVQSAIETVDTDLKPDRDKTGELKSGVKQAYDAVKQQVLHDAAAASYHQDRYKPARRARELATDILRLEIVVQNRLNFLLGSIPYFKKLNELPRPVASGKTDAEGKFSVTIPDEGEFAIAAHAERRTPTVTEKYFWLVPATDHTDLSNDNLTSATGGASLLHVVGDDNRANESTTEEAIRSQFAEIKNKYADIFPAIGRRSGR